MKPTRSLIGLLALAAFLLPAGSLFSQANTPEPRKGPVYVIPIQGDIEASTPVFVQLRVKAALAAGAGTIVFTIDTFGGRVDSALRVASIIGGIREADTVAFVGGGEDNLGVSWSAGALIAMAARSIYMAPGTSIGAAAPVVAAADGSTEGAGEKAVSAVRAQMAALAEKNGYPASLALAMVDADVELVEVYVDEERSVMETEEAQLLEKENPASVRIGRTVVASGKLLSLTAGDAERYKLSSGTVFDLAALLERLGYEAATTIVRLEPNRADSFIMFLTSGVVQSILILIGLIALFIEINSPGFGIPGSIALIAFVMLFGSNMFMGTVGSLELILFIIGIGLLVVEIFVLPGFGLTGISGLLLIIFALVLSMQDFVIPSGTLQWDTLLRNLGTVGLGVLSGLAGIGLLIAFGPRLRLFDGLTLKTRITATASGDSTSAIQTNTPEILRADWPQPGTPGVALSVLRPAGRARINNSTWSVESDGTYIEAGTAIRVLGLHGNVIVVQAASPDNSKSDSKEL